MMNISIIIFPEQGSLCANSGECTQQKTDGAGRDGNRGKKLRKQLLTDTENWLLRAKWLHASRNYTTMTTNIVIPDYAAVFISAFDQLVSQPLENTDIYIPERWQHTTLFPSKMIQNEYYHAQKTALVNTEK